MADLMHQIVKKKASTNSHVAFDAQSFISSIPLTVKGSSSSGSNSGGTGLSETKITANELFTLSHSIIHRKSNYFSTNIKSLLYHIEQSAVNKFTQHNESLKSSKLHIETKKDIFLLAVRANKCLTSSKEHEASLGLTRSFTPNNRKEGRRDSKDTSTVIAKLQKMLNITPRQYEDWMNEIEATTHVERWIEITIEEANHLMQGDAGTAPLQQPNPYCKFGLMANDEAFVRNKKGNGTNWDACDSICISNARQSTTNPKWRDTFKIPLFAHRNLVVLEVWDQKEPQLEVNAKRRGKCIGTIGKGKKKDVGSQYIGRCAFDISNAGSEKEMSTEKLLSHSGKSVRGQMKISTQIVTSTHDEALENLKKGDRSLELFQILLTEWGRFQLASGKLEHSLPEALQILLKKIAELLGLSHFQSTIGSWPYFANYLVPHTHNRDHLIQSLLVISSLWDVEGQRMTQTQVDSLVSNMKQIYEHDMKLIEKARLVFPPNNQAAVSNLTNITKFLQQLFKFLKHLGAIEEEANFQTEITAQVEKDVKNWFNIALTNAQPKFAITDEVDQAGSLADVLQILAQDLADSLKYYPNAFGKIGINYFEISLGTYDHELNNAIKEYFSSYDFDSYFSESSLYEEDVDDICERAQCSLALFRLFIGIRNLVAFKQFSSDTNIELSLEKYHSLFKPFVKSWIDSLRFLTHVHTETISLDSEAQSIQDTGSKISNSALEMLQIFEHCHDFYNKLQWPFIEDSFNYAVKVTDIVKDLAKSYVQYEWERITKRIKRMLTKGEGFDVSEELCLALNNSEFVIHYLEQARSLDKWARLTDCFPLQASSFIETIEGIYDQSLNEISSLIEQMIEALANAFQAQFKEYFVGFMAKPEIIEMKKAIYDLENWLEQNIASSKEHLPQNLAIAMIEKMWNNVISMIMPYKIDISKCDKQYSKLFDTIQRLYDMFFTKGQLPRESLLTVDYTIIYEFFQLHTIKTQKLIEGYCQELVKLDKLPAEELGTLTFSAMYSVKSSKLEVNVIKTAGLHFLEEFQNYKACVKVSVFPEQNRVDSTKTKVFNSGINPTILQEVSFSIPMEIMSKEGVLLSLSIYSEASKENGYGGTVYYPLKAVQQNSEESEKQMNPESLTLPFILPTSSDILQVLQERTGDKMAAQFLKKLSKRKLTDKAKGTTARENSPTNSVKSDKKGSRFLTKLVKNKN